MTDPLGLISGMGGVRPEMTRKVGAAGPSDAPGFKDMLLKNISEVNKLQQNAETALEDLVSGKRDDMANVLNATRQADLAFKTLLQVRNKLMEAYEEIKQLRV